MRDYLGTVIFTSHDQLFVDQVANEVYQVVDQKLKKSLKRMAIFLIAYARNVERKNRERVCCNCF